MRRVIHIVKDDYDCIVSLCGRNIENSEDTETVEGLKTFPIDIKNERICLLCAKTHWCGMAALKYM